MSGGDDFYAAAGDYSPSQTAEAVDQFNPQGDQSFDPNTVYTPPGQFAPGDQWNFTPDPNAPGGFQAAAPGTLAPLDQVQFSNATGQYPNDQAMQNAVSNQVSAEYSNIPTLDAYGMATTNQMTPPQSAINYANSFQYNNGQPVGYTNWGRTPVNILPANAAGIANPNLAPGYIPGSGSYNQYDLGRGNLFGPIGPNNVFSNLNYGVGGPGDPTTGLEVQTPPEWLQGENLFSSAVGNLGTGQGNGTDNLDYIATLFARGDTPSGLSTAAFSAGRQYWDGLYQAIQRGIIQPSARGWQLLQQMGYATPAGAAGTAPQGSMGGAVLNRTPPGGSNGAPPGTVLPGSGNLGGGTAVAGATPGVRAPGAQGGPMGPGSEVFNYNRTMAELTANGQRIQNKQFYDQLAFNKAVQDWLQNYQQNQMAMGYLGLTSQLRGPADLFQYLRVLGGTPQGIRDVVNAAAGAYRMPRTGATGQGGTGGAASIDTLLNQMNDPGYGAEANNLPNLPPPNQISAANLMRMTPAQRDVLLAAYEAQGWRPEDVTQIFANSLPQYVGSGQAGRVALFG